MELTNNVNNLIEVFLIVLWLSVFVFISLAIWTSPEALHLKFFLQGAFNVPYTIATAVALNG